MSSKYAISVGASVLPLVDSAAEDPMAGTIQTAILTGRVPWATLQDIPGHIIQTNLNGFHLKVDQAYDYAVSNYQLGLPSGATLVLPSLFDLDIIPYITAATGHSNILITHHEYLPYDPIISISDYLINTRGYNVNTNEISEWPLGISFTQYWDEDTSSFPQRVTVKSVIVLPDGVTARVTYAPALFRPVVVQDTSNTYNYNSDNYYVEDQWVESTSQLQTEDIPIPGASPSTIWQEECLFVTYKLKDGETVLPTTYIWVYHLDGTYLDLHPDVEQKLDTFLPVIPIRFNNEDLTDPATQNVPENPTNLYSTSKKLMEILGLDLQNMGDRLKESPDIGSIDHAYIMFAVNVQTEHQPSQQYLSEFFYRLYLTQRGDENSFNNALTNPELRDEPYNDYSYYNFSEYGLSLDILFDYITSTLSTGIIDTGTIGTTEKSFGTYIVEIQTTRDGEEGISISIHNDLRYKLILKTQVAINQIRTIEIHNLRVQNNIYKGSKYHVLTTLKDIMDDPDQNGLIIPIQYNLVNELFTDTRVLNLLYNDSLVMVINAIEKKKLKWYERSWFKAIVMVVAIVISVISFQYWIAGAAAASSAAGITVLGVLYTGLAGLLMYTAITVLVGLALSYLVSFIIKEYGAKIGIIGAVILTVIALVISRGMSPQASQFMLTSANALLQVSSALISSANEFLIEQAQKMSNEFELFKNEIAELWEGLETVYDLLAMKADYDPLIFLKPPKLQVVPNENPTVFFNRCLGLVDNTMFTIHDEIPNFYDMRLRHVKDNSPLQV